MTTHVFFDIPLKAMSPTAFEVDAKKKGFVTAELGEVGHPGDFANFLMGSVKATGTLLHH